ncbi:MAG: PIN domain nuclease [Coxiella sp. (in: Bacteria)]|nr:MAG: PIN domain nuclease [Coxiella sp. (in: g-proteobacteria)]
MKILFDTNIVLDVLLAREPFVHTAAQLFAKVLMGKLTGYLCANTITTIDYLLSKSLSSQQAKKEVAKLLQIFDIAPVTHGVLESALGLKFKDYEDTVIHESGKMIGVKAIVTRDHKGFAASNLSVYSPDELLTLVDKL